MKHVQCLKPEIFTTMIPQNLDRFQKPLPPYRRGLITQLNSKVSPYICVENLHLS